jgi:hypothetical protein
MSEAGGTVQYEEYANLRLQTKIKDFAVFNAAFNLIAASGALAAGGGQDTALASDSPPENYSAHMELERLPLRINGECGDADMGLMRLAFGYGQVFGPSDFLNPRNPLYPAARPRVILGLALSFYPREDAKVQVFASAPRNALAADGGGWNAGLAFDTHWSRASLQAIYVFETPDSDTVAREPSGTHRVGASVKADVIAGFVADALYTYDRCNKRGLDGLSASGWLDYSFLDERLYLLAEHLFSGSSSITAFSPANLFGYSDTHNACALVRFAFSDYTSVSAACLLCFGDATADTTETPILTVAHEIFQGFPLTMSVQAPLQQERYVVSALGRLKF